MDSKKTNLTPELKEIYDRVMNTSRQAQKPATAPTPPSPTPTTQAPPAAPTTQAPPLGMPVATSISSSDAASPPSMAPTPTPAVQSMGIPSLPEMPTTAEDALTSTPARPVTSGNTIAFSGNVKDTQTVAVKKKSKISAPILIVLGIVFIAVWGVFWAVILGLVKI